MILFRLRPFRTVDELDRRISRMRLNDRIANLRRRVRIAVIDDQDFAPLENLRKHNYDITPFKTISSIDALEDFQILLVDIHGVARELSPTEHGAHLIREIKKNFPEKFVIAYTGGASQELLAPSIDLSDQFTQKDTAIGDWCDLLDAAIIDIANPAYVWRKLRSRLLDAHVTPFQLSVLEDSFVKAFDSTPHTDQRSIVIDTAEKLKVPGGAKSVLNSLVASAIFELFMSVFI